MRKDAEIFLLKECIASTYQDIIYRFSVNIHQALGAELLCKNIKDESLKKELFLFACMLFKRADSGDTRMGKNDFKKEANNYLPSENFSEEMSKKIERLTQSLCNKFDEMEKHFPEIVGKEDIYAPIIKRNKYYYLHRNLVFEKAIINGIKKMNGGGFKNEEIQNACNSIFSENLGIALSKEQNYIVSNFAKSSFSLITGGPGTGKTSTIVSLARLFIKLFMNKNDCHPLIKIAAPTGRAAQRVAESIAETAEKSSSDVIAHIDAYLPKSGQTLHSLLKIYPPSSISPYGEEKIAADLIIVDEASMIDISVFASLFDAVSEETFLILSGDGNQLPSVEGGAVFSDLLCAGEEGLLKNNIFKLTTNFRSIGSNNRIPEFAEAVNSMDEKKSLLILKEENESLSYHPNFEKIEDLYNELFKSKSFTKMRDEKIEGLFTDDDIIEKNRERLNKIFNELSQSIILCGSKNGDRGVYEINERIATYLNSNKYSSVFNGLPIMITENDHKRALFNGERGVLLADKNNNYKAIFRNEKGYRSFAISELPAHEKAYAITVHKSQGSEYNLVYLILDGKFKNLLKKEILYTAATRAKEKLIIYADEDTIKECVQNKIERDSGIQDEIKNTHISKLN